MAVPVTLSPTLHAGPPVMLFAVHAGAAGATFESSPDGKRFLVSSAVPEAASPPFQLIVNWRGLVKD